MSRLKPDQLDELI